MGSAPQLDAQFLRCKQSTTTWRPGLEMFPETLVPQKPFWSVGGDRSSYKNDCTKERLDLPRIVIPAIVLYRALEVLVGVGAYNLRFEAKDHQDHYRAKGFGDDATADQAFLETVPTVHRHA